ncbi:low molecular weight phosphotyrosine protein phosphatase-like isoform X1 [Ptychodera flava]|uniref:low molecular weight phosphotyrosine protein phosphatase-like isoform X1 n=1 Tax=Ptychodera flava TaxID=63121 RepID=UPI00396A6BB0
MRPISFLLPTWRVGLRVNAGIHNMAASKKSVLFVCLGNICRSPMAECVLRNMVHDRGDQKMWEIDSAATSTYELGDPPDPRTITTLKNHGLKSDHIARQITRDDFTKFQYIFGMDESNLRNINAVKPNESTANIMLLGSYDPKGHKIIQDPYYGGVAGFEVVFEQVTRCCEEFLKEVYSEKK